MLGGSVEPWCFCGMFCMVCGNGLVRDILG